MYELILSMIGEIKNSITRHYCLKQLGGFNPLTDEKKREEILEKYKFQLKVGNNQGLTDHEVVYDDSCDDAIIIMYGHKMDYFAVVLPSVEDTPPLIAYFNIPENEKVCFTMMRYLCQYTDINYDESIFGKDELNLTDLEYFLETLKKYPSEHVNRSEENGVIFFNFVGWSFKYNEATGDMISCVYKNLTHYDKDHVDKHKQMSNKTVKFAFTFLY